MSRTLWILQSLLAAVFLFSGVIKLVTPIDVLQQQLPLSEAFIRFIGVAETLGAIGLVLPSLLRIRPGLTPLAAACLAVLMAGATVLTPILDPDQIASAALPLTLGLLCVFVAYGRVRKAPIHPRSARRLNFATR
jgi:uncharacterized membrane protein